MEIVHIDMDMFYAAVEIRDNPDLAGKPLIIGALPHERGVVSTCSYEARKFGVRSAMSIKEAYRLCPHGIYKHPNGKKYVEASRKIHEIWDSYTDLIDYVSLDEGFLDVTRTSRLFGGADLIGRKIKERTKEELGLTCSAGIGYSMMSAKLASEEKKPDGFFQILTPEDLKKLIIDRSVRVIYGVGPQMEMQLNKIGIHTVRDIYNNRDMIISALGNQGIQIVELAHGIDRRVVGSEAKSRSMSKEVTFQHDITDRDYIRDVLRLIARELSFQIRLDDTFIKTITLKVTFRDMKKITRSRTDEATNRADKIYATAARLLEKMKRYPIRLVGISLSGFTHEGEKQISLFDDPNETAKLTKLDETAMDIQRKYGIDSLKTGSELIAEKRLKGEK